MFSAELLQGLRRDWLRGVGKEGKGREGRSDAEHYITEEILGRSSTSRVFRKVVERGGSLWTLKLN
jgi:hypothetical protein